MSAVACISLNSLAFILSPTLRALFGLAEGNGERDRQVEPLQVTADKLDSSTPYFVGSILHAR